MDRVSTVPVAIALGSNLGDRRAHIQFALDQLSRQLANLRVSAILETAPFDVPGPQPPYLNAAAVGDAPSTLEPQALLDLLLSIEQARGRRRPSARAPRTLDLDLILFGDRIVDTPTLTVPHPRFRERLFVLEPLVQLAAEWADPVSGKSAGELLAKLQTSNFKLQT